MLRAECGRLKDGCQSITADVDSVQLALPGLGVTPAHGGKCHFPVNDRVVKMLQIMSLLAFPQRLQVPVVALQALST